MHSLKHVLLRSTYSLGILDQTLYILVVGFGILDQTLHTGRRFGILDQTLYILVVGSGY